MTTISKFYFHDNYGSQTGLPGNGTYISTTTPNQVDGFYYLNRAMDAVAGSSQTSVTVATGATKSQQLTVFRRWVSAPIAAQTIGVQSIYLNLSIQQSNTNANMGLAYGCLAVWRPSTGALVGRLYDSPTAVAYSTAVTTEYNPGAEGSTTLTSVTAQNGDVLIFELWARQVQSKATSYNDTMYYDGTTDYSQSNCASYIRFTNAITMAGGGTGSFTADAIIRKTTSPSVTASSVIRKSKSSTFTADARIEGGGSFTANAVIKGVYPVTANAILKRSISGTFTASASIGRWGSITADAFITVPGGFARLTQSPLEILHRATDANIRLTQAPIEVNVLRSDAVLMLTQALIEAIVKDTNPSARLTQAVLEVLIRLRSGQITADAVIKKTGTGSLTADASITSSHVKNFTADAVVIRHFTGTFTADANLVHTISGSFTANGVLRRTSNPSFSANAVIKRSITGSFTADAATSTSTTHSSSLTSDAIIWKSQPGSITANAITGRGQSGSVTANAVLVVHRTGSFTANAALVAHHTGSFTADAFIPTHQFAFSADARIHSNPTPGPRGGYLPTIRIDGTDITNLVVFKTATFTSMVNGNPGTFVFDVKDIPHTFAPIVGKKITLDIYGIRYFTGFVTRATRHYAFEVEKTTVPTITDRLFQIEGVDINILFTKRIAYNKADATVMTLNPPAAYSAPRDPGAWRTGTDIATTLNYLLSHYTDLGSDGVTFDVSGTGSPNPDGPGTFSASVTVGSMLSDFNLLLESVYFISPTQTLTFRDADVVTTDYYITDQPDPSDPYAIGPRNYTILSDGANLANDVYVWGAALGYGKITAAHVIDNDDSSDLSSVTIHGRWQWADFDQHMYKQASVNERANSYVYGLTQSQKGHRWDAVTVEATTFQPVFMLGDVVHCEAHAYYDVPYQPFDTPFGNGVGNAVLRIDLPIRRMEITFPTPTAAQFKLTLSRELDDPFNAFEYLFPKFKIPSIPPIVIPPVFPPLPPGGCTDAICGITDTFTRAVSSGWGTSDAGPQWALGLEKWTTSASVDGSMGIMTVGPGGPGGANWSFRSEILRGSPSSYPCTVTCRFRVNDVGSLSVYWPFWVATDANANVSIGPAIRYFTGPNTIYLIECYDNDSNETDLYLGPDGASVGSTTDGFAISAGVWYNARVRISDGLVEAKIWADGSNEPLTWASVSISNTIPITGSSAYLGSSMANIATTGTLTMNLDDLDISGVNRCTQFKFDSFSRTVASGGWGTSDTGYAWSSGYPVGHPEILSVGSGDGFLGLPDIGSVPYQSTAYLNVSGPWNGDFTFIARFAWDQMPSGSPIWDDIFITSQIGAEANIQLSPSSTAGQVSISSGGTETPATASFNFASGTWYQLEWVHHRGSSGTDTLTVWPDGSTKPGTPTVTKSSWTWNGGSGDLFQIIHVATAAHTTATLFFDWIDFSNYAGRPCYQDCTGAMVLDTFTRTVNPGWGTSDSGSTWSAYAYYPALDYPYTDGSNGLIKHTHRSSPAYETQGYVYIRGDGPWRVETQSSFTMTTRFRLVSLPSDYSGSEWTQIAVMHDGNPGFAIDGVSIIDRGPHGPVLEVEGASGSNYVSFTWATGVWYWLKWNRTWGGTSQVKCWAEGNAEPDWMVSGTADVAENLAGLSFFTQAGGSTVDYLIEFDSIVFGQCNPVSGESGYQTDTLTPISGLVNGAYPIGSTWQTTLRYVPGSVRLAIDGNVVASGFFTETNPVTGVITMNSITFPVNVLTVVYVPNGAL